MRSILIIPALATALAGCNGHDVGEDEGNSAANVAVSAEGKAEEGKIKVKAPGFDLAISLPKEMSGQAKVDRDSKILYPGATIEGVAIAAGPGGDTSGDSEVEMRFSTSDPIESVAAWYRDPARAQGFHLESARKNGADILIEGKQKRDRHGFRLRLSPRASGGTDGRLTVRHRD
ncbi:MAG TPA: hypothetical protein VHM92_05865 [Allosphingosinicella sp.]|nr:hypothetical protein [Allosphingosinicella sp.]